MEEYIAKHQLHVLPVKPKTPTHNPALHTWLVSIPGLNITLLANARETMPAGRVNNRATDNSPEGHVKLLNTTVFLRIINFQLL